jgi:Zn-dependent protease
VLLGTMALFALAARSGEQTWMNVVLLIGVLLLHEAGHWLGMRAFGFQNVRMFFIPFFGAAVSGRNTSAASWKEGLVLLLGPLPGLVLGCGMLLFSRLLGGPELTQAGTLLVALNGFNLLPVMPLDGGRFFQLLLFSRHRYLEMAFSLLAVGATGAMATASGSWVLGILAWLLLVGLFRQGRLLRMVHVLRGSHPELAREASALEESELRALHAASAEVARGEASAQVRAQAMRDLHDRVRQRPPSLLACLGLGTLWVGGVLALLVGLALIAYTPRSTEWQRHADPAHGFSVSLPGPSSTEAREVEWGTPEKGRSLKASTVTARLDGRFTYSVTVVDVPDVLSHGDRERLFDRVRDAYAARERLTLQHESAREVGGQPGRSLLFSMAEVPAREVNVQVALGVVNGRLYLLSAERDARFLVSKDAQRFFESFEPLP